MKMSEIYPDKSTWLKAADLQGRRVVVQISHVTIESVGDDGSKAVVYMMGKEKGLVLNKTNAAGLASMYGDDMDQWANKQFEIYPTKVDYGGKMVDAIRVAPPPGQATAGQQAQAAGFAAAQAPIQPKEPDPLADLSDSIPF